MHLIQVELRCECIYWCILYIIIFICLTGPVAAALVGKYGCRPLAFVGGLISVVAVMLSSFSETISHLYCAFTMLCTYDIMWFWITFYLTCIWNKEVCSWCIYLVRFKEPVILSLSLTIFYTFISYFICIYIYIYVYIYIYMLPMVFCVDVGGKANQVQFLEQGVTELLQMKTVLIDYWLTNFTQAIVNILQDR